MTTIPLAMADTTPSVSSPTVTIRWQRLVGEQGGTCARCGGTETEVQQASVQLAQSLEPLGVAVVLQQQALDAETFMRDVDASNRIWINDRPLEEWLGADVGASGCTYCCTEAGTAVECRTLVLDGQTFETIPSILIVKAGLMAGAQTLGASTARASACGCGCGCGDASPDSAASSGCC